VGRKLRIIWANGNILLTRPAFTAVKAVFFLLLRASRRLQTHAAFPVFRVLPTDKTATIDCAPKKQQRGRTTKWQTK
jgi:hypothetical protein